jgi:UDP-3-O-[3-hydroxymyristoyl] glucosamine N-acyltransferase
MSIAVSQIAETFGLTIVGNATVVDALGGLNNAHQSALYWSKNAENLAKIQAGVVICSRQDFEKISPVSEVCYLLCDNARLTFSKVVYRFFKNLLPDYETNCVDDFRARIDLSIGQNVFIGKDVEIGAGTKIAPNVVIYPKTKIGENCLIQVGASIGTEGLGLEKDPETNTLLKFPQIGGVVLEDFVEIGPYSTIRRSALNNTVIGKSTKIGSYCNVGHNCVLGTNNIITSNVIIAGSTKIGNDTFLGIACSIKHGMNIGSNATIGQGSVVVKHVPEGETWVGNPAKKIER